MDNNEEYTSKSPHFGRISIRQVSITSIDARSIGDTRRSPSSKHVKSDDTKILVILESASYADTICAITQFRKILGMGVIFEVGAFGDGLGKFQVV